MQSQGSTKSKKEKRPTLPWGLGSIHKHGQAWWIVWRDLKGKAHHKNSGTRDYAEAMRLLAEKSLPRARAAVALLERIANGEETYQGGGEAGRATAEPGKAGRNHGAAVSDPRPGARQKKTPRGEK